MSSTDPPEVPTSPPGTAAFTDAAVNDDGVELRGEVDLPVDVCFGGRRVASFWSVRDTTVVADPLAGGATEGPVGPGSDGVLRRWSWPAGLRRRLVGRADVVLVAHGETEAFWSASVSFAGSEEPLDVVDRRGNPMALDKSNRLTRVFEDRDPEQIKPLLDSMDTVIAALRDAGVEPFIAYGTLLGAVREGGLIGHDSDADLGYVSRHDHPADIALESFELQRRLVEAGYEVHRYSGGAVKVVVLEGDGARRGLDVFAGFLRGGRLYLMGEVGAPFHHDWIFPLSVGSLEGREFPIPAVPERLLEAMYGPTWRTPDPAYKFDTPRSTTRRLNGWFRGTRVGLESTWGPHYSDPTSRRRRHRSDFTDWVETRIESHHRVIDLGCGRGKDVMTYARAGHDAVGLDFVLKAYAHRIGQARRQELPAHFDHLNLNEVRSVAAAAANYAAPPDHTVLTAHHVLDAVNSTARANLLRLARALLTGGGRLYAQVALAGGSEAPFGVRGMHLGVLRRQIEAAGGTVVEAETSSAPRRRGAGPDDGTPTPAPDQISRLVITWP